MPVINNSSAYRVRLLVAAFLFAFLLSLSAGAQILQYYLYTPYYNIGPYRMVYGPDGAYWLAEYYEGTFGRTDTNGNVSIPFAINADAGPYDIIVGPDSNLWFTEKLTDTIGRISPGTNGAWTNGVLTEFRIHPNSSTNCQPACLAVGADGNLWFTEYGSDLIGVMNTNGQMLHEYGGLSRTQDQLVGIAAGPDGAIWFTELTYGTIGRITTNGQVTEIPLPDASNSYSNCTPLGIIAGPDGAMWFTEYLFNRIGRLTVNSNYSDFVLPTYSDDNLHDYSQGPYFLTIGGDSNIWFTEAIGGNLSRIIPSTGFITEFPNPNQNPAPTGLASGKDKNIWFIELNYDYLAEFLLPTLSISVNTNSQYVLSWPVAAADYLLQGNSNLLSTNWINLTSPPPVATTNLYIYTNTNPALTYFRLYQYAAP